MRGKWTEGPWTWNERDAYGYAGDDQCAARISAPTWEALARVVVRFAGDGEDDHQGVANAHLIAASPAMADELAWIIAFAEMRSKDDSKTFARVNRAALRTIADRARAALSLAHPPSNHTEESKP